MIRLRRGRVLRIVAKRPGAVEMAVEVEGHEAMALAYPDLVGPVPLGSRVVLNTTAVALGLGTGGQHFIVAVEDGPDLDSPSRGRTMKLRYTPLQLQTEVVEEAGGSREAIGGAESLAGTPVVWTPLHSLVGPVSAGAVAAGAKRVAYVMTDGAALPAALSRLAAALRSTGFLAGVVTAGQAFGGDLEAVNVFSGLLAARYVAGADVIVVGDGPGNTGTNTRWGTTAVASAMSLNAAAILSGRPLATLRISFADRRRRHRGVSHHSLTALRSVALVPVHVAIPALSDADQRRTVWNALKGAGLEDQHQLVETTGVPALEALERAGIEPESMGRGASEDPAFFLAGGAAGVLAGRMAARSADWRRDPPTRGPAG